MQTDIFRKENIMFIAVVNLGTGSKVLKEAKEHGISGGTIFLGKGTAQNHILEILGLDKIKKEIVLMVSDTQIEYKIHEVLIEKFHFNKPNHGIVFSIQVNKILGSRACKCNLKEKEEGDMRTVEKSIDYEVIFTIVDRGFAEEVVDVATRAGAQGGTIINGRGSGVHENSKFFGMSIEPEKEIIMILIEKSKTDLIVSSIRENLNIDAPGKGIIFTMDVNKTSGLFNSNI